MSAPDIDTPLAKQVLIAYRMNLGTGSTMESAVILTVEQVMSSTSFPVHREEALLKWVNALVSAYHSRELAALERDFAME